MSASFRAGAGDGAGWLLRCIRDLVALNAIPSMCIGRSFDEAFDIVLDALPTALDCELVDLTVPGHPPRRRVADGGVCLDEHAVATLDRAFDAASPGESVRLSRRSLHFVDVDVPFPHARGRLRVARASPLEADTDRVLVRSAANLVGTTLETARVLDTAHRKDEFIATLSHELRNPLAPLRGATALLRVAQSEALAAHARDVIDRQVHHLSRLVDDLLEASRISRGTLQLRREPVDLAAVLRSALEVSEPNARDAGLVLEVSFPAAPVWVNGDPVRLAQVVSNLLNNAARFTERGGAIALAADAHDGEAVVRVTDTGCGFVPEAAGRLFEMFAKSERSPGLGIGLALAKRLVEMHGGTIAARSEGPGRGAEFVVRLPVTSPPEEAPAARDRDEARPAGTLRVLIADDNIDSGEILAALLGVLGHEVALAQDGEQAIELARTFRPDVGILDIGMPRLDGYETARRIRSDASGRRLMLVAVTGFGQEDDRRRAREAGFDEHLVKPAELDVLRRLLASFATEAVGPPSRS